jgi:predicted N-formylglutamate amidohydrolase
VPALLDTDEPVAVELLRPEARSPILLVCDHAGRHIPRRLKNLGLPEDEIARHIGWDIGIAGVVRGMAEALDAPAILQPYSRLVIDCNRGPGSPASIPVISENTFIPGNRDLAAGDIAARQADIFVPYHDAITRTLDARRRAGIPTILVAMHSFTPVYKNVARLWHIGTLYNRQIWIAEICSAWLRRETDFTVGDNEPYAVTGEDYTIPMHGEQRSLPHVGIEIRQDLIENAAGQRRLVELMTRMFRSVMQHVQGRQRQPGL